MKTIKMVADELGVTKQTIVNNAKSLNISFEKMELIILMIMIV
jgi:predicted transcriptional regulator